MSVPSSDALHRDLQFAIANKRLLQLTYNSLPRIVEPHDYGRLQGVVRLLVYQIRGGSGRRGSPWRLLDVAKIEGCTVLDETFAGSRGAGYQRHKEWDEVFARVR